MEGTGVLFLGGGREEGGTEGRAETFLGLCGGGRNIFEVEERRKREGLRTYLMHVELFIFSINFFPCSSSSYAQLFFYLFLLIFVVLFYCVSEIFNSCSVLIFVELLN